VIRLLLHLTFEVSQVQQFVAVRVADDPPNALYTPKNVLQSDMKRNAQKVKPNHFYSSLLIPNMVRLEPKFHSYHFSFFLI
jgi:hypothetical protein